MIFFTAYHHFGHENIIKYCNRPFASVEEMDAEMIRRWNEVVSHDDTVYHLGDFTLGRYAQKYFEQLHGEVRILRYDWHHDRRWLRHESNFLPSWWTGTRTDKYCPQPVELLPPLHVIKIDGIHIALCHYPLAQWDRKHHGAWHLHGHSHGNYVGEGKILDVGVDCHNFYPVSEEKVVRDMGKKE